MSAVHRAAWVVAAAVLVTVAGCATGWTVPGSGAAGAADQLAGATRALEAGQYGEASTMLRGLASRCEAGRFGRRALLLLAATALDPRNPEQSPDEAGRLAARFLGLPETDPGERVVAETLYLLALDRGAGIQSLPTADEQGDGVAVRGVAPRFRDCGPGGGVEADREVTLPDLPGVPAAAVRGGLEARADSLADRLSELEAELERIRALLRQGLAPDTSGTSR